jgi:phosphoglycerate kinase
MAELEKDGFTKHLLAVRDLIHAYNDKIETPFDFAYADENGKRVEVLLTALSSAPFPTYDIGAKTSRKYAKAIANSKTVFIKGPCGKYEQEPFQHGTKTVLEAIAGSKAYTLIGGGHTLSALEKFKIPKEKIAFISIAGGALLEFLQGNTLPAVAALEISAKKFGRKG